MTISNGMVTSEQGPYRLSWRIPAADFAPGLYRVDVSIDNRVVDTREYDVLVNAS